MINPIRFGLYNTTNPYGDDAKRLQIELNDAHIRIKIVHQEIAKKWPIDQSLIYGGEGSQTVTDLARLGTLVLAEEAFIRRFEHLV